MYLVTPELVDKKRSQNTLFWYNEHCRPFSQAGCMRKDREDVLSDQKRVDLQQPPKTGIKTQPPKTEHSQIPRFSKIQIIALITPNLSQSHSEFTKHTHVHSDLQCHVIPPVQQQIQAPQKLHNPPRVMLLCCSRTRKKTWVSRINVHIRLKKKS